MNFPQKRQNKNPQKRSLKFSHFIKDIMKLSNIKMAYELSLFGIDRSISHKTVERLYSNHLVIMILNNLDIAILRKKWIRKCDSVGDGTGYSLTVAKHYRSLMEIHGESVNKEQFVYSFALMDLNARMYTGYGVSMRSEKDQYME